MPSHIKSPACLVIHSIFYSDQDEISELRALLFKVTYMADETYRSVLKKDTFI